MTQYSPAISSPEARGTVRSASAVRPTGRPSWPVLFLAAYITCQIGLLFLAATPLRLPLRIGTYAISLLLLVGLRTGRVRHPGAWYIQLVIACCLPGIFFNAEASVIAAAAEVMLYIATLAPLLWVSSQPITHGVFRAVVLMLWGFNVASATTGVLQTYYPGQFQGQISTVLQERGKGYLGSLTILLDNGTRVFRPMGLTDQPGGASSGGMYAILLGVGVLFTERSWIIKGLAAAGMVVGLFVIFISHIRVTLVMALVGLLVIAFTFARRGDFKRLSALVGMTVGIAVVGTVWAFAVGGEETAKRFRSLTETSPTDVYSQNRGLFLEDTFTHLVFEYPLGAGPGRWGMINIYFGEPDSSLWAEIMWTAWVYDGGIPLMVVYCILLAVALYTAWQIGTNGHDRHLATWGAVVLAYDVAAIAGSFDAPFFATQAAVELWFLNACLFGAFVWKNGSTPSAARPPRLRPISVRRPGSPAQSALPASPT